MDMNEIERKFYNQLVTLAVSGYKYFGKYESDNETGKGWETEIKNGGIKDDALYCTVMHTNNNTSKTILMDCEIIPQFSINNYRVDFMMKTVIGTSSFDFFIEIDGFEWHDRNRDEFVSSRLRQNDIVQCGTIPIIIPATIVHNDCVNSALFIFSFILSFYKSIFDIL
jgi:hypothetical protein